MSYYGICGAGPYFDAIVLPSGWVVLVHPKEMADTGAKFSRTGRPVNGNAVILLRLLDLMAMDGRLER